MITDGDYVWAECPFCGKLDWCFYRCDISAVMAVYLCCEECEENQSVKNKSKPS